MEMLSLFPSQMEGSGAKTSFTPCHEEGIQTSSCLLRAHTQHSCKLGKQDQHTDLHLGEGRGQLKAGLHKVSQGKGVAPHAARGGFCRWQLERLSSLQPVHEEPKHPPELEKSASSRLKYGRFQIWPQPTCSSTRSRDRAGSNSPICHGRQNTKQCVPARLAGK